MRITQPYCLHEQLLRSNGKQFRGGLVFKACRLVVSLKSRPRVIKEKKKRTISGCARLEQPYCLLLSSLLTSNHSKSDQLLTTHRSSSTDNRDSFYRHPETLMCTPMTQVLSRCGPTPNLAARATVRWRRARNLLSVSLSQQEQLSGQRRACDLLSLPRAARAGVQTAKGS